MKNKKIWYSIIIFFIISLVILEVIAIRRKNTPNEENVINEQVTKIDQTEISDNTINNQIQDNLVEHEKVEEESNESSDINEVQVTEEKNKSINSLKQDSQNDKKHTITESSKQISQESSKLETPKSNNEQSENKIQEQPKKEEEKEIAQVDTPKCTSQKHGVAVGNSNRWFNSQQESINYYQTIIKEWGDKWEKFEIDDVTYQKNCPYGYEIWSCPFCEKWTINFYYN